MKGSLITMLFYTVMLGLLTAGAIASAAEEEPSNETVTSDESNSYIDVTTIEEDENKVKGSPTVTAIPEAGKPVDNVKFFAKAINTPDDGYYPYPAKTEAPFQWGWWTGESGVPDGKYMLRMDITYLSGEVETITREIIVENTDAPNAPISPANLEVTSITDSSVSLSWEPAEAGNLYNYVIYQDGVKIGETKQTAFDIQGLAAENLYHFQVKTQDIYGNVSIDDNSINILTPAKGENKDPLPSIGQVDIDGPEGKIKIEGVDSYSGSVQLAITVDDSHWDGVDFFVKGLNDPDSLYRNLGNIHKEGNIYSTTLDTTSMPDGKTIVKVVVKNKSGQVRTISKVFLVANQNINGYPYVNEYIKEQNLSVVPLKTEYNSVFPKFDYRYGHDAVEGVVAHETANPEKNIWEEIEYMNENYNNAFVHAFVDDSNIIEIHPTDYAAWGAGRIANERFIHVELVRVHSFDKFARSINNYADYIASLLYEYNLGVDSAEDDGNGTLWSHNAVTEHLGGTTHTDPIDYFARWGYDWNQFITLVEDKYAEIAKHGDDDQSDDDDDPKIDDNQSGDDSSKDDDQSGGDGSKGDDDQSSGDGFKVDDNQSGKDGSKGDDDRSGNDVTIRNGDSHSNVGTIIAADGNGGNGGTTDTKGGILPITATPYYTMVGAGALLILIGGIAYYIMQRRKTY